MCSYDALIRACPAIDDWVRLDQSQADCSHEHQCPTGRDCPIGEQFQADGEKVEAVPAVRVSLIERLRLVGGL